MPNKIALGLLAAAATAAAATAALAQQRPELPPVYMGGERPDMPAVNPRAYAPGAVGPQQTISEFGSWSRAHGDPRILLFWNRALSDDTTTRYRDRTVGAIVSGGRPGIGATVYEETREQERTTGGTHTPLSRDTSFDYETGFVNAFLRSGANIVDRNALMRKASTRHGQQDRSDQQFIEAVALEEGVQYLVEVLPDYRASPTGFQFTVKITHLPSSRVHAQFRTSGSPLAAPSRLVARPGGYRREAENRNTPEFVAEALAADTMRRFF